MSPAGSTDITQYLGNVFICKRLARFEFYYQTAFDQQVGIVIAKHGSVFVAYRERALLFNLEAELSQTMRQSILIYFLQMPVTEIGMQIERDLPDSIA